MKNLIILSFAVILFATCKKNYTCSCTESIVQTGSGGLVETNGEYVTSYTKVTKKYANERCTSGKDVSTSVSGTSTVTVDHVWNCSLNGSAR